MATDDLLERARSTLRAVRAADAVPQRDREISEGCEESRRGVDERPPRRAGVPDPFLRWRLRNAEHITPEHARLGHDPGGFCAAHNRWLTWNEQQRGACSWCMPIEPEREPEYWASHWKRFTLERE